MWPSPTRLCRSPYNTKFTRFSKATITASIKLVQCSIPASGKRTTVTISANTCFQFDCRVPQATVTDYGASNAGLLEHVGSALTLVTIVMNRTIVFSAVRSNVNNDSIFLVTEKYLVFTFLLVKLVQKIT